MKKIVIAMSILLIGIGNISFTKYLLAEEVEVIWEKQLDEPVVDVIFGEEEVTVEKAKSMGWKGIVGKTDKQKIKVSYPKVSFISNTIYPREKHIEGMKFYDKKGNVIKQISTDIKKKQIKGSANNKYIILASRYDEYDLKNQGGVLYRDDGTEVWHKDTGIFTSVSNAGYTATGFVSVDGENSPFVIYNPLGQKIKEITLPEDVLDAGGRFSEDGLYYILCYGRTMSATTLMVYDLKGNIKFEKQIPEHILSYHINLHKLGVVFTTFKGNESSVFFFNWNGILKWKISVELPAHFIKPVPQDTNKIIVVSSFGYIWCIDVQKGEIVWKHKEAWATNKSFPNVPLFDEVEIIKDSIFIKGTFEKIDSRDWYKSAILIFDGKTGNLILKKEYPNSRISLMSDKDKIFLLDFDTKKISSIKLKDIGE